MPSGATSTPATEEEEEDVYTTPSLAQGAVKEDEEDDGDHPTVAAPTNDPEPDTAVTIVKGPSGFGISINSPEDENFGGTFVVGVKPDGTAAVAFAAVGLAVSDCLRIKSINGVDLHAADMHACVKEMMKTPTLVFEFTKDPKGFQNVEVPDVPAKAAAFKRAGTVRSSAAAKVGVRMPSSAYKCTVTKGASGFGVTINSPDDGSNGTYVTAVNAGGATDFAFEESGLNVTDGLRIKTINGVELLNGTKDDCVPEMLKGGTIRFEFIKDLNGFQKVRRIGEQAAAQAAAAEQPEPEPEPETAPPPIKDTKVTIHKGKDGFGMVINSAEDGSGGTFVMSTTPGGSTDFALEESGLIISEGLWIKSINGVDLMGASKEACVKEMIKSPKLVVEFRKQPELYTQVLATLVADRAQQTSTDEVAKAAASEAASNGEAAAAEAASAVPVPERAPPVAAPELARNVTHQKTTVKTTVSRKYATEAERIDAEVDPQATNNRMNDVVFDFSFSDSM
jgi:hypothetical protein